MIDYFDRVAPAYHERSRRGLWRHVREREWRSVRAALEPREGESILDLGCGSGFYARRLHALGVRVCGVDCSGAMVAELAAQGLPTINARAEEFRALAPFDKIVCAGLLEFTEKPERILLNCRENLSAGGRLVLLVPSGGVSGLLYRWAHEVNSCPTFIRSLSAYAALARAAGFAPRKAARATLLSHVLSFTAC